MMDAKYAGKVLMKNAQPIYQIIKIALRMQIRIDPGCFIGFKNILVLPTRSVV